MTTTIDKAGRVVIPASIRADAGLSPGSEIEVLIHEDGSIRLLPKVRGLRLERKGDRWIARPSVTPQELPAIDFGKLIDEERDRWPW